MSYYAWYLAILNYLCQLSNLLINQTTNEPSNQAPIQSNNQPTNSKKNVWDTFL
jgi:hypothetical protein